MTPLARHCGDPPPSVDRHGEDGDEAITYTGHEITSLHGGGL